MTYGVLQPGTASETNKIRRRSGQDRRAKDPADYLDAGGDERREFTRRRTDRRMGWDRRKSHSLEYFTKGGVERRSFAERRQTGELRTGWVRISDWSSICLSA